MQNYFILHENIVADNDQLSMKNTAWSLKPLPDMVSLNKKYQKLEFLITKNEMNLMDRSINLQIHYFSLKNCYNR